MAETATDKRLMKPSARSLIGNSSAEKPARPTREFPPLVSGEQEFSQSVNFRSENCQLRTPVTQARLRDNDSRRKLRMKMEVPTGTSRTARIAMATRGTLPPNHPSVPCRSRRKNEAVALLSPNKINRESSNSGIVGEVRAEI